MVESDPPVTREGTAIRSYPSYHYRMERWRRWALCGIAFLVCGTFAAVAQWGLILTTAVSLGFGFVLGWVGVAVDRQLWRRRRAVDVERWWREVGADLSESEQAVFYYEHRDDPTIWGPPLRSDDS